LSNYRYLLPISKENDLIYFSPSDIAPPEKLKTYLKTAADSFNHKKILQMIKKSLHR
jgi:hypothetical protein